MSVDEKIVKLKLDNSNFKKNSKESLNVLAKLKEGFNFEEHKKAFKDIDNSSKQITFKDASSNVDKFKMHFSALEVVAMTTLSNITNRALRTGEAVLRSLTIEPVFTGFNEYEQKIGSVQTILANTQKEGANLKDVNRVLDELNLYADKTIYNFQEMTRNIGTFTAAGVKLDTSAKSIKGIANLAALSGSNSQQASVAMYQLSQALAAGTVKLMDWNSVVNAGMGGQVFQDALKETARVHGIAIDEMIQKEGSFRETLQKGWLTSEILTETLDKFTGDLTESQLKSMGYNEQQIQGIIKLGETANDAATKVKTFTQLQDTTKEAVQSGWAQTWELILGDFEETRAFFTSISDLLGNVINKSADARNTLLSSVLNTKAVTEKDWKDLEKAGVVSEELQAEIIKVAKTHGIAIDEMIQKEGSFTKSLKKGWLSLDIVKDVIKGYNTETKASSDTLKHSLDDMKKIANEVINGSFGDGSKRKKMLADAGYDYSVIQKIVNNTYKGIETNMDSFTEAELKNIGITKDQTKELSSLADQAKKTGKPLEELVKKMEKRPSGRELFLGSIKNTLEAVLKITETVGDSFKTVFEISPDSVYNVLKALNKFTKGLIISKKTSVDFKNTLKGLFSIFKIVTDIANSGFKIILGGIKLLNSLLKPFNTNILKLTGSLGKYLDKSRLWVENHIKLDKIIDKIGNTLYKSSYRVKMWLNTFKNSEVVLNLIKNMKKEFKELQKNFEEYIKSGAKGIEDFINKFKDIAKLSPKEIKEEITKGIASAKDYVGNLGNVFDKSKKSVREFYNEYTTCIGNIKSEHEEFFSGLKVIRDFLLQIIKQTDLTTIMSLTYSYSLIQLAKSLDGAISAVNGVKGSITGLLGSIKKYFKAKELNEKASAVLKFAAAFAVLAASAYLLTKLPKDKLITAVSTVAIAVGLIIGSLIIANKYLDKVDGINNLTYFALSIAVLVTSLRLLTDLDIESLGKSLISLGLLLGSFVSVAIVLSKTKVSINKIGKDLLLFSVAIGILSTSMHIIAGVDENKVLGAVGVISALMIVLSISSKLLSSTNKDTMSLIWVAISVRMMAKVLISLDKIDFDVIKRNILKFITIIGMLGLLMATTKLIGANTSGSGLAILGIMLSIKILIGMIQDLNNVKMKDLGKAMLVITGVSLLFSVLMASTYLAGKYAIRAGIMLIAMAAAARILAYVVEAISKIDPKGLARGVAAVSTLLIMFSLLVVSSHFASDSVKSITALSMTVGVLVGSVAILSLMDDKKLKNITMSLSSLLIALSLLAASSGHLEPSLKNIAKTIISLVSILAVMIVAMKLLSMINPKNVIPNVKALTVLVLSLSAVTAILSAIGKLGIKSSIDGALGFVSVVGILGTLFAAIGGLTKLFPELKDFINNAQPILDSIGNIIGSFVGNIAGGFMEGVTDSLPEVGNNLTKFATNALPFFEMIKGVDASCVEGVKNAASAIWELTKSNFLSNLGDFIFGNNDIDKLGSELESFGIHFKAFADITSQINPDVVSGATAAAKSVAEMAKAIPNEGGLLAGIVGDNTLGLFGVQLAAFAPYFSIYAFFVKGIDEESINASARCLKVLATSAGEISNSGGLLAFLAGDNTLGSFGLQLAAFGPLLKIYSNSVIGIDEESINASARVIQVLASTANEIPNHGGLLALLSGDNTLVMFGLQLAAFGPLLSAYAWSISGIENYESIYNSIDAIKALINMASSIPNSGGFISLLKGDNTMSKFGRQMVSLSTSLAYYSNNIEDINTEKITSSLGTVKEFVSFLSGLKDVGPGIVSGLQENLSSLAEIGLPKLVERIKNNTTHSIDSLSKTVKKKISTMNTEVINKIESFHKDYKKSGEYLGQGFVDGIKSKKPDAKLAGKALAKAALEAANKALDEHSPSKEGYKTGAYLGIGFVNGIASLFKKAGSTGTEIATIALSAINNSMDDISNSISEYDPKVKIIPDIDLSSMKASIKNVRNIFESELPYIGDKGTIKYQQFVTNNNNYNYDYNQNISSPKYLSRRDIYRNSRNLFAQVRKG